MGLHKPDAAGTYILKIPLAAARHQLKILTHFYRDNSRLRVQRESRTATLTYIPII